MTVGTFHAVCHRMLRRDPGRAWCTAGFSVYDARASRVLLAQALAACGAGAPPLAVVERQLGQARARLLTPARYRELGGGQAIYGWRGAEVGHVLAFEGDYPGARVAALERN